MNKTVNFRFSLVMIFYFAAYAATMAFASSYLLHKGLSDGMIGVFFAGFNILSVFGQSLVAGFIQRHPRVEVKDVGTVLALAAAAFSVGLIFAKSPAAVLLFATAAFTMLQTLLPLTNVLAFVYEDCGAPANYGFARGCGGLSYAVMGLVLGRIITRTSEDILPFTYILFGLLLAAVLWSYRRPPVSGATGPVKPAVRSQISVPAFMKKYKRLTVLLTAILLVYVSHNIINNYLIQIITDVGGTNADMGTAVFLASLFELPVMAAYSLLIRRFSDGCLLRLSLLAFLAKHIITTFAASVGMIYLAQTFHMLSFGLFMPAAVSYIKAQVEPEDIVRGQSMLTVFMTLSNIVASLAGGALLEATSVHSTMLIVGVVTVAGVAVALPAIVDSRAEKKAGKTA